MRPGQSSELCPLPPDSLTTPPHRGQHVQDGVYVPPLARSEPRGRDSSALSPSLPRPHPLTPRYSHLTSPQPEGCLKHSQPEDQGGRIPGRPATPASWLARWNCSPEPGSAPGPAWQETGVHADGPGHPALGPLFPGIFFFSSYSSCFELRWFAFQPPGTVLCPVLPPLTC